MNEMTRRERAQLLAWSFATAATTVGFAAAAATMAATVSGAL